MLDGKTLGNIYLRQIKKWDDEAIAKLNPGLKLPSQNIAVVRRADEADCLLRLPPAIEVNEEWKNNVGTGSVEMARSVWAVKSNDGIAAFVQRLPGAISLR